MNTSLPRRPAILALLPLCCLILMVPAWAAHPAAAAPAPGVSVPIAAGPVTVVPGPAAATVPAPASAPPDEDSDDAPAQDRAQEHGDWRDQADWHDRNIRHGRHEQGNDIVSMGHDSNLAVGQRADSVVSIAGSSTSEGEAQDVVSILGDTRITGDTSGDAVAVFGDTHIDGKLAGDAVAVFGNIELGPHAEVGGNVVDVGGTVRRDPAAIIHGGVQNVLAADFGGFAGLRAWIHHCLFYGRPLALAPGLGWAWGLAFACLALYAALALLFRDGLTRCVQTFEAQPGQSVLAALIAMLLTPVLVVLLCITVIGIAAVPFLLLGLFCVALFGKAVMLAWVGRRVTAGHEAGRISHPAVAVLIGGLLVLMVYLVPVLGFLVYKLLGFLGLGAVVYTLILAVRARQTATRGPGDSTAAHAAGSPQMQGAAPMPGTAHPPGTGQPSGAAYTPGPQQTQGPEHTSGPGPAAGPSPAGEPSPGQGAFAHGAAPAAQAPPVTAALPRAGFWIRMGALLLDVLIVGFVMGALHHAFHLELLVLGIYGAVMWKLRGSTLGGIVFDLRVIRLDGREIDWETAIVRALGCFLSLAVAGLGFIWIAFDHNNQAWHDKIAGTVVVRVAKGTPLV